MSEENLPKNKQITLRPTPKILKLLEEAQKASGSDRTDLILSCIENALDEVVQRAAEKRLKEAQDAVNSLKKKK